MGIRGIRKVASVEIPVLDAGALGLAADAVGAAGARVKRVDYFVPQAGPAPRCSTGSTEELAGKLVDLLKAKGGIK